MRTPHIPWLTALGGLLMATTAAADWPLRRHDPQHTGTSPHRAALEHPAVTWRYSLGATLGSAQLITADVDGDGMHEIIFIEGGRVVARTLADEEVWSRPIPSVAALSTVIDFDGDGNEELVVTTGSGLVHLLALADGSTLWRSPDVGRTPSVRVGQFDDDPRPELLLTCFKSSRELFVEFVGGDDETLPPTIPIEYGHGGPITTRSPLSRMTGVDSATVSTLRWSIWMGMGSMRWWCPRVRAPMSIADRQGWRSHRSAWSGPGIRSRRPPSRNRAAFQSTMAPLHPGSSPRRCPLTGTRVALNARLSSSRMTRPNHDARRFLCIGSRWSHCSPES